MLCCARARRLVAIPHSGATLLSSLLDTWFLDGETTTDRRRRLTMPDPHSREYWRKRRFCTLTSHVREHPRPGSSRRAPAAASHRQPKRLGMHRTPASILRGTRTAGGREERLPATGTTARTLLLCLFPASWASWASEQDQRGERAPREQIAKPSSAPGEHCSPPPFAEFLLPCGRHRARRATLRA